MRCTIKGCKKPGATRKWCVMHYARWRKYGDFVTLGKLGPKPTGHDVTCPTCKKVFYLPKCMLKKANYCSRACRGFKIPGGLKEYGRCAQCDGDFRYYQRPNKRPAVFCGRECMLAHWAWARARRRRAAARKNAPRETFCYNYAARAEGYCRCGEKHSQKKNVAPPEGKG